MNDLDVIEALRIEGQKTAARIERDTAEYWSTYLRMTVTAADVRNLLRLRQIATDHQRGDTP